MRVSDPASARSSTLRQVVGPVAWGTGAALVLSILDRGEGAAELYEAAGVPFKSLFRAEEFLRD